MLNTDIFDDFWVPYIDSLGLSDDQIKPYEADPELFEYDTPLSSPRRISPSESIPHGEVSESQAGYSSFEEKITFDRQAFTQRRHTPPPLKDYVPEVTRIQKQQEKEDGAFHPNRGIRNPDVKSKKSAKRRDRRKKATTKRSRLTDPF